MWIPGSCNSLLHDILVHVNTWFMWQPGQCDSLVHVTSWVMWQPSPCDCPVHVFTLLILLTFSLGYLMLQWLPDYCDCGHVIIWFKYLPACSCDSLAHVTTMVHVTTGLIWLSGSCIHLVYVTTWLMWLSGSCIHLVQVTTWLMWLSG
jgi:hypothetical protein